MSTPLGRRSFLTVTALAGASALAGCGTLPLPSRTTPAPATAPPTTITPTTDGGIVYSNLGGPTGRQLVTSLFTGAGLTATDDFFATLDQFNKVQDPVTAGLVDRLAPAASKKYDFDAMAAAFKAAYPGAVDRSAREVAFSLLRDSLSSGGPRAKGPSIMMEIAQGQADPGRAWLKAKPAVYINAFNDESVRGVASDKWRPVFPAALKARGVKYASASAGMVNLISYNPSWKTLFVGHAGVRFASEGHVWLLEKLGVLRPYQLTRYPDDAALKADLLGRPDFAATAEWTPILLINGLSW